MLANEVFYREYLNVSFLKKMIGDQLVPKYTFFFTAFFLFLMVQNSFAKESETIYAASIKWEDEIDKTKLLELVTVWDVDQVTFLFNAYRHPEHFHLPLIQDTQKYNLQFINAFWGPLENPFIQYPRPTKAFVFIGTSSETFYMAPLIKNLADGNYYIFDKSQKKPILLNEWVSHLRSAQGFQLPVRFNICQEYGTSPNDICKEKTYQDEVRDIYPMNIFTIKNMPSARRAINEDWRTKVKLPKTRAIAANTIYGESIPWNNITARNNLLNTVTGWSNYQVIKDNFIKIRDIRYFNDEESNHFLRRITWLYPDDGCWTRATAAIKDLFGPVNNLVTGFSRPSKIFAFGNLCVNTSNSPNHSVYWWYHTAPIVKDAQTNQFYVLDPAVNPYKPLLVEDWIAEISSNSKACAGSENNVRVFNICNGYGTGPFDYCNTSYETEIDSMLDQSIFRRAERDRQVELGREADKVLGDVPPWLN